jgi:hypothetical protein
MGDTLNILKRRNFTGKFCAILTVEAAMKAVERNGYALRYVLLKTLFLSIAVRFKISIEE